MSAIPRSTGDETGFTLVELLVSLAILGLVAAMLAGGLGTAGLLAARGRQADARLDGVVAAQGLLRARLEQLRPELRLAATRPIVDASGTAGSFDFLAPPLGREQPDALRRYRLAVDRGGDLVLYSRSTVDARSDGGTALRLLHGVAALSIHYYGPDGSGTRRWLPEWTPHPQPPDAISVRLAFGRDDRRVWPALLVRPRATVNASCRIDQDTGRCGGPA